MDVPIVSTNISVAQSIKIYREVKAYMKLKLIIITPTVVKIASIMIKLVRNSIICLHLLENFFELLDIV
jgi:hypothetical protein